MTGISLSFCIGVYNEEKILVSNLTKIKSGLNKITNGSYEIIIVDNGSTDRTAKTLQEIKDQKVKVFFLPDKGLGSALRLAITKAKGDIVALNAIDLPFGFGDLKKAIKIIPKYDIILGSKMHPHSKVNRTFKRRITSFIWANLLRIFFKLKVGDTQGSIFFRRDKIKPILRFCHANNAFFTTQLIIYSQLIGLRIVEIPVELKKEIRPSKYSIYKDGLMMFKSILHEFQIYKDVVKTGLSEI